MKKRSTEWEKVFATTKWQIMQLKMGKESKQICAKDIEVFNEYMQSCSTSVVTGEMQIKP